MNFPEDFADAHNRHWKDGERLFGHFAWANADHLYGLSAECGLKAVLVAEGQPVERPYKRHVDDLWPEFVSFAQGRSGATYLSLIPTDTPFQNWRVSHRYAHRRHFSEAYVTPHRNAACAVRTMLQSANLGGQP